MHATYFMRRYMSLFLNLLFYFFCLHLIRYIQKKARNLVFSHSYPSRMVTIQRKAYLHVLLQADYYHKNDKRLIHSKLARQTTIVLNKWSGED